MTDSAICWACGARDLQSIFAVSDVPTSSLALMETEAAALEFPTGDIELVVCRNCSFVFNVLFQPDLVDYTVPYEESQAFSPRFEQFEQGLVDRLISTYPIEGNVVFEIGCGKASFLDRICRKAGAKGIGIDPAFDPDRVGDDLDLEVFREFFNEDRTHLTGNLICCRHTLEHIQAVDEFVSLIARSASRTKGSVVYIEVPDVERIFDEGAFWDVYYEHCSYFARSSLERLVVANGFKKLRLTREFDSQYLLLDATLADTNGDVRRSAEIVSKAEAFGLHASAVLSGWRSSMATTRAEGKSIAVWGASSKTVSFLSALPAKTIEVAVDINPYKQGKFLPGSGIAVIAPEELRSHRPDVVVVMNPIYRDEISQMLDDIGLQPELLSVGDIRLGGTE